MRRAPRNEIIASGILSGLVSGVCMWAAAVLFMGLITWDFFFPLRLIGATLLGMDALSLRSFQGVTVGLVIHLIVSSVLGISYAALTTRRPARMPALLHGMIFGAVVWVFMTYLVLPVLNPIMFRELRYTWWGWALSHLVFGGILAVAPVLKRARTLVPRWNARSSQAR
jgi:uncharacterized membrane protein YagU involved in acid resistance